MKIDKIDNNFQNCHNSEDETSFYSIENNKFIVHGLLWFNENNNFNRLENSIHISENIDLLQRHPSGAYISFQTDSSKIDLRVRISQQAYMSHMSAIGQTGLDLYVLYKDKFIFLCTTKINEINYQINLIKDLPRENRQYRLYLPLYVELNELYIGIDCNASIQPIENIKRDKVICYGTSITQGGCVTRPGMNYPSIIGRSINYEVINFGFSGNGHLHTSIAEVISNVENLKYLIIEAEANAGAIGVLKERLELFINVILKKKPKLNIIIISHFPYSMALLKKDINNKIASHKKFQKQISEKYNIKFIDGQKLLKRLNYDESVDGIHLTDLGFYFLAKEVIKIIKNN